MSFREKVEKISKNARIPLFKKVFAVFLSIVLAVGLLLGDGIEAKADDTVPVYYDFVSINTADDMVNGQLYLYLPFNDRIYGTVDPPASGYAYSTLPAGSYEFTYDTDQSHYIGFSGYPYQPVPTNGVSRDPNVIVVRQGAGDNCPFGHMFYDTSLGENRYWCDYNGISDLRGRLYTYQEADVSSNDFTIGTTKDITEPCTLTVDDLIVTVSINGDSYYVAAYTVEDGTIDLANGDNTVSIKFSTLDAVRTFEIVSLDPSTPAPPVPVSRPAAAPTQIHIDNEYEYVPHVHNYVWVERGATEDDNGELIYQCEGCGDVLYRVPTSAYYVFNRNTVEKIQYAEPNATVDISTQRWISFHEMVMRALSDRPDVTLRVSFLDEGYKGQSMQFVIPAGTDAMRLVDDEGYTGFLYLRGMVGEDGAKAAYLTTDTPDASTSPASDTATTAAVSENVPAPDASIAQDENAGDLTNTVGLEARADDTNDIQTDTSTAATEPTAESETQSAASTISATSTEGATIVIPRGVGSDTVAELLESAGLVDSARGYDRYLCDNGYDRRIRSGSVTIPGGASYEQIAELITSAAAVTDVAPDIAETDNTSQPEQTDETDAAESVATQSTADDATDISGDTNESASSNSNNTSRSATATTVTVRIPEGITSDRVAEILREAGLVDSASDYDDWLCDNGYDRRIRSGTKEIPSNASWQSIAEIIITP